SCRRPLRHGSSRAVAGRTFHSSHLERRDELTKRQPAPSGRLLSIPGYVDSFGLVACGAPAGPQHRRHRRHHPPAHPGEGPSGPESGRATFDAAHIPGAQFAELLTDFADEDAPEPWTAAASEKFARSAGRLGIGPGKTVVVHDQSNG